VAVPKVCGIETEYAVLLRGTADANPVLASSMLINAYVEHRKVGWDFDDESPGRDARGFGRDGAQPPEIETHLVNTVLTNGARYYVDHAHPEYSTPECADALELVCADKAGERILSRSMRAARRLLDPGQEIVVYKNNSDGKGNSYGCHENYLVSRQVPFVSLVRNLLPWFVSRQVFTGAGKVGTENGASPVDYQISARADFFEEEVGLETTLKRPLVNTRDEPHADPQKYRRLHVIVGDANLCEVATYLKVGTTAIVLAMIEDDFIDKDLSIIGPVHAVRTVSHDPTCRATLELVDGGSCTAVELQWEFLRLAQKYADETGLEECGGEDVGGDVLKRWEAVLTQLERDPMGLDGQLDWVTKLSLLEAYRDRDALGWDDPKLALLDLQYHDVRPERSLYERLVRAGKVERLVEEADVIEAMTEPPGRTRAYFRGTCLSRWPDAVVAANWDSIILDVGSDPLRRIPMMEPLKGSKAMVERLFGECTTPAELVERLAS
jgi:Pup amidohydrolase